MVTCKGTFITIWLYYTIVYQKGICFFRREYYRPKPLMIKSNLSTLDLKEIHFLILLLFLDMSLRDQKVIRDLCLWVQGCAKRTFSCNRFTYYRIFFRFLRDGVFHRLTVVSGRVLFNNDVLRCLHVWFYNKKISLLLLTCMVCRTYEIE